MCSAWLACVRVSVLAEGMQTNQKSTKSNFHYRPRVHTERTSPYLIADSVLSLMIEYIVKCLDGNVESNKFIWYLVCSLFVSAHDGRTYGTSIRLMILRQHQRSSYHTPFRVTNATIIRTIYRSARSHTAARPRPLRKWQQLELGSVTDRYSFSRTLACILPKSMHEIYGSNDYCQYTPFNISDTSSWWGYFYAKCVAVWHRGCLKNEIGTGWSGEREIRRTAVTSIGCGVLERLRKSNWFCVRFVLWSSIFVCCHSRATEYFPIDILVRRRGPYSLQSTVFAGGWKSGKSTKNWIRAPLRH